MNPGASSAEGENRQIVRYPVSFPAKMHVTLSKESGGRLVATVEVTNLSTRGAGVRTQKIKKEHVAHLAKARRKCLLLCQLPDTEPALFLTGEIVWLDIHADNPPSNICLGVALKDMVPAEQERLTRFLDSLAAKN
jgi:hypothetical protein